MGRTTTEKVGRGICPNASCGEPVTYRKSAGGMLTHKCDCCDSSGYAEPGGTAYRERMATIKGATPETKETDRASVERRADAAHAGRTGFNLGAL